MVRLGDIADILTGYPFPGGEYLVGEFSNGVRVVRGENVSPDGLRWGEKTKRWVGVRDLGKYVIRSGDALISMDGNIGRNICIAHNNEPLLLAQRVARVRALGDVDQSFLNYVVSSPSFARYLNAVKTGTTISHISQKQIEEVSVNIPTSVTEQRSIAAVLSSLDDKIELLRRQNETLEQIAQAIFNERFVKPTDGGVLPKGWQMVGLTDIGDFLNGIALQKYPAVQGEPSLPAIKIRELKVGITEATDRASVNVPGQYIVEDGDILFSWSGSLEVVLWHHGRGALNQHLFKVSSDKYPQWFVYLWLLHHLPDFRIIAANKATTMGHIQRHHLDQAEVVVPDEKTLIDADALLTPIFNKIIANNTQSRELTILRGTLLPRLISGEIRVNA